MTLEVTISNPSTEIERQISELGPWFHNLHLPDGTQTALGHPLGDFPAMKWDAIAPHLPQNLENWNILDIGCNAGFYSFEFARRGARVIGIDIDEHYLRQAQWAAERFKFGDRVSFRKMQVYDIQNISESFDIILFMGVFYHLRYPLLALDLISMKFTKMMIFQTLTMPGEEVIDPPVDLEIENRHIMLDPGWPKMAFIEKSLEADPTNWWAPNHAAVEAMLRSAGLTLRVRPAHEIYICGPKQQNPKNPSCREELKIALKSVTSVKACE